MATISGLLSQTSSYETFVSQLVELESQKKYVMESQRTENNNAKKALGAVSSAISDLENIIEELSNSSSGAFEKFSYSTTDSDVVKVNSVSGFDSESAFNITIDRLATNDIALSTVMTGDDEDLAAFGDGEVTITIGDKTETINVATTKDDGDGGTVNMTNEEILQAFADEIESLFGDEARASVFQTNSSEVQFSIQSLATGYDNRVQISGATGVLAEITGGITHLTAEEELDAQFTIDGVTFERSSNTVEDAIEGLSFTLLDATGEKEQMNVSRDIDASKDNVEEFIDMFNELNETIRERTFINPDSGNKGPLQGMRSIRNLSFSIRQTGLQELGGLDSGVVARLSDIGIAFENDGTMVIEDSDLLEEILSERPEEITNFFSDENSPIATMKAQLESYTQSEGILSALEDGVDLQIDRLDRRIKSEEKYLEEYEAKQRLIFNQLDLLLEEGQAQYEQVMNSLISFSY